MQFGYGDVAYWERTIGSRLAAFPDRSWRELDGSPPRLILPGPEPQAVYVVVDADDEVVYVGKCHRADGCVADRFRSHHAWQPDWDRVWVFPLADATDPVVASRLEHTLIRYYDPVDNTMGLPEGNR